jgi:hypothetical protein
LTLVACGSAGRAEPAVEVAAVETSPPSRDPASGPPADIRVASEEDANLHLWVSNQSFVDDTVHVSVSIDDVDVVSSPFAVEDQHNWVLYPICTGGTPCLRAVSDTGVEMEKSFVLPERARRYAVVDYWNDSDEGGRYFSWLIQSTGVAFA